MIVLHSSDLHSNLEPLFLHSNFDVWIDTGDIMPNRTRGRIAVEQPFQADWLSQKIPRIATWLAGRPMLSVQGNHDFISLADHFIACGINATQITSGKEHVLNGITFAGFSEIPWICGDWSTESRNPELQIAVRSMLGINPDVLLTHAPPHGILDNDPRYGGGHYGIQQLTHAMMYVPNKIKHHLFGHIHERGGESMSMGECQFHNSAQHARLIEL
jgi:Icc-related predicted phosphoesterase